MFIDLFSVESHFFSGVLLSTNTLDSGRKCDSLMFQCTKFFGKFTSLGEFLLRLRHLEKSLLTSLNEAKGRILDDDSIITNLEMLKKEAQEIAKRVEETDATIAEVESTSHQYSALAQSCSSIYFTLESLNQVGLLMRSSVPFHYSKNYSNNYFYSFIRSTSFTNTPCNFSWTSSAASYPVSLFKESATTPQDWT